MWGLLAGIVSYPFIAWYSHRRLEEQGLPSGFTRTMLVFLIATALSTALGYGVSWLTSKPEAGGAPQQHLQQATTQLLGHELQCLQNPASAACQSAIRQSQQLKEELLSGGAGRHEP
ncbi:MAG: hypothetical protein ACYDCX_07800 [Acidithiobacillus sp.]